MSLYCVVDWFNHKCSGARCFVAYIVKLLAFKIGVKFKLLSLPLHCITFVKIKKKEQINLSNHCYKIITKISI